MPPRRRNRKSLASDDMQAKYPEYNGHLTQAGAEWLLSLTPEQEAERQARRDLRHRDYIPRRHPPAPRPDRPVTPAEIIHAACQVYSVTPERFRGSHRDRATVLARWTAAALCREMTRASYPEIAEAMGRPTHSTVVSAVKRIRLDIQRGASAGEGRPPVVVMYESVRESVLAARGRQERVA